MVLCSVRLITIYSLPKSLHKDLYPHSTHCMQIILKSRFQFPHWVMKNVLFPKVITIFKLIYLLWFKIEQTLPGFGVTRFTSACVSACFLSPFRGSCATWLRRSLNSKTLSTAHNGKTNRGRPRNLQRIRLKLHDDQNNPIKPLTVTSKCNESKRNGKNNAQMIMAACT